VPAIWRMRRRPLTGSAWLLVAIVAVMAVLTAGRAAAAPAAAPSFVKYYVVTASFQGQPETLNEIAARLLGSAARSEQIFDLNVGRPQPSGGELANPAVVDVGWILILPWDAVGAGVREGLLPTTAPAVPAPPPARPAPTPRAKPTPAKSAPAKPAPPAGPCAGTPSDAGGSQGQWAMLRVAPQHAWAYSRGAGVDVAVVDSGVDASVPGLARRVTAGVNVIAGTGGGNSDCLGSGTAMAGIIAGGAAAGSGPAGVAPDAVILPVRVAPTDAPASAANQASAVEVAADRGAKVIALGSFIDPAVPAVAAAIRAAARRGVVVVAAAPARSAGAGPAYGGAAAPAGTIWVGGIGISGAAAAKYQPGTVDVVAPGADISSLGMTGTGGFTGSGTRYAVAFVAGEAALVRARYPRLSAAGVVLQIEATADQLGPAAPDATFGWGLIDPGAAVTRAVAHHNAPRRPPPPAAGWSSPRIRALAISIVLALVVLLVLVLRIRRIVRPAALPGTQTATGPPADSAAAPSAAETWQDMPASEAGFALTPGPAPPASAGAALAGARAAGPMSVDADGASEAGSASPASASASRPGASSLPKRWPGGPMPGRPALRSRAPGRHALGDTGPDGPAPGDTGPDGPAPGDTGPDGPAPDDTGSTRT
jgi:membrane-anchored mycosin MYCP